MDILSASALMFLAWGFFFANCIAFFIVLQFRKNYPFTCDNIHCQNLVDHLATIFSFLAALSIGLIILLNVLIFGWSNMLILVIFIAIFFAYLGLGFRKQCVARKDNEEIEE